MRKLFWLSLLFPALIWAAQTWSDFTGHFYAFNVNTLVARWDSVAGATQYEARLVYLDKNIRYPIQASASPQVTFSRPRAGHFAVEVRAGNTNGWSAWVSSLDDGRVGGQSMPWMLFWQLPAPGGVILE